MNDRMHYLSHDCQNMVADVIYKRFFREQGNSGYTASKINKMGSKHPSVEFSDLQDTQAREPILEDFAKEHPIRTSAARDDAKKLLAYCVERELKKITDAFQKNHKRPKDKTDLEKYILQVEKLMLEAEKVDDEIEIYYGHTYYFGSNHLKERFKDVRRFCDDKLKVIDQVVDFRIYEVRLSDTDLINGTVATEKTPKRNNNAAPTPRVGRLFSVINPHTMTARQRAEAEELDTKETQSEAECQDIAKALIGKNEANASHRREHLRERLADISRDYHCITYKTGIGIPYTNLQGQIKPPFALDKLNWAITKDKKPNVFYILDGNDQRVTKQKGFQGTQRLYPTVGDAYYAFLRYYHSRLQSKGNGLEGGESFVSEYSPERGWAQPAKLIKKNPADLDNHASRKKRNNSLKL